MATHSNLDREAVLAARQGLWPTTDRGWRGGFGNMLGKELGDWFGTRRWIWQMIIWVGLINGFIAFLLFVVAKMDPSQAQVSEGVPAGPEGLLVMGLTLFFSLAVVAGSIGTIILAQDEIIHEKQSGTAAWILSKPVSRQSFILTKLLSNMVGVLIFIVGLPGLVTLIEVYLASGRTPALLPYLAGAGVVLLTLIFYLTLVVMLGVLFEQRGPVLGVTFGLMFGGLIASSFIAQLGYILPLNMDKIALAIAQGQALPAIAVSEVASTAALSLVFTSVALWRFHTLEF